MRVILTLLLTLWSTTGLAVGPVDEPPTNPTVRCTGGQVFDPKTKVCVDPKNSVLERDTIFEAVRHLAYTGRYHDAQTVLEALPQDDPGRLTYLGFTHRKLGNTTLAKHYYLRAIASDPANILARSYMGQGLVEEGDLVGAMAQLDLIRWHGGAGTWSEESLRRAIATGETYNY